MSPNYEGKVKFEVINVSTQEHKDEIKGYDIGNHGLVGLSSEGNLKVKIPGHEFGKDEITAKIDELQTALNQLGQQLIQANPQAQNMVGQLNAYNDLLAKPELEALL